MTITRKQWSELQENNQKIVNNLRAKEIEQDTTNNQFYSVLVIHKILRKNTLILDSILESNLKEDGQK